MKKAFIWTDRAGGILCFTSLKPLSYKENKFEKNYPELLKFLRTVPPENYYARQIHGKRVLLAGRSGTKIRRPADGFAAFSPGCMLLIFTADCLPVFIYDGAKGHTAITHCGWKGAYKEIAANAVRKLRKRGSASRDLKVILGPCIRECCYEVDAPFIKRFAGKYGKTGLYRKKGKNYFSLADIVKLQLKKLGIPARNIKDTKECTCCQPERYFSYRRDGKGTGRMVSGIMIEARKDGGAEVRKYGRTEER